MDLTSLRNKIILEGFEIEDFILDGRVRRFATSYKPKKKNGWYVGRELRTDSGRELQIITVGDWATGEKKTFRNIEKLSADEMADFSKASKKMQRDLKAQLEEERAAARSNARAIWGSSNPVDQNHKYLIDKKIVGSKALDLVRSHGVKVVVPVMSLEAGGEIESLQMIDPLGNKDFLTGGSIKDNFFFIDGQAKQTVICEGFATAVSIYEAFKGLVNIYVAFNAGNMFNVAKKAVMKYGMENVTAACDDDCWGGEGSRNAGRESGALCSRLGIRIVYPEFPLLDPAVKPTDFNDMHELYGLDSIRKIFFSKRTETLWPSKDSGFYRMEADDRGNLKMTPQYYEMAYYFRDVLGVRISDSAWMRFNGTHYDILSRNKMMNMIVTNTNYSAKPAHFKSFVEVIKSVCDENSEFKSTKGLINFKNGVLNTVDRTLSHHSTEYDFRYCLPYDYDASADCPRWMQFLDEVFQGDKMVAESAAEIFGYTVMGGVPFLHKAFLLIGGGRNGKSVFLKALQGVLGDGNYSTISLESLEKDHFRASLQGKLANISPETTQKGLESSVFKAIVAGDEITDSFKFRDHFSFKVTARVFFSSNFFPKFRDSSDGMIDRLYILPFNRQFKDHEQDRFLSDKIAAELPGIFNWALEGAERLIERGSLPETESAKEAKHEYQDSTDSVYNFINSKLELRDDNGVWVKINTFYPEYIKHCADLGLMPKSKISFGMAISNFIKRKCGPEALRKDRMRSNETSRYFLQGFVSPQMGSVLEYRQKAEELAPAKEADKVPAPQEKDPGLDGVFH